MAEQMTNYGALKNAATTIKNEVEDGANTANRVGDALLNLVEATNEDIGALKDAAGEALGYTEDSATFNDF